MTYPSQLRVRLHGTEIGMLTLLPGDRTLFTLNESYVEDSDRPILSLSLKGAYGGLITELRPTQTRIPPWFSNLLPEGPMREYLARRAGMHSQREFFLLQALGQDLPGAVIIEPLEGGQSSGAEVVMGDQDSSQAINTDVPNTEGPLRFSLAGVQLKFSAIQNARGGLTLPAEGIGGSWIVKLPSMSFAGVPENEFTMMLLARAMGMDVPEVRLMGREDVLGLPEQLAPSAGPVLAIRRFDRLATGGRVHMEDFAQVFGVYPERKYERASYRNIAEVLWAEVGETAIAEMVRRLIFNVLIGNADAHLKNWSLLYTKPDRPELAPAYDLVSTIAYMDDSNMALKLAKSKRMDQVNAEQLAWFASKAGVPKRLVIQTAQQTVEHFTELWPEFASVDECSPRLRRRIDDHLGRLPIVRLA